MTTPYSPEAGLFSSFSRGELRGRSYIFHFSWHKLLLLIIIVPPEEIL
jgi:hypothetical protein